LESFSNVVSTRLRKAQEGLEKAGKARKKERKKEIKKERSCKA
jgi:hypothetical protein